MAKIKNGSISGLLGNLVAYRRNGKDYLRKAPERKEPPTPAERANRYIFKLVQEWVNPINDFLKLSFRDYSEENYGANAAKSLIHRHALTRDGFDSYIDPSKVQVSSGSLSLPSQMEVVLENDRQLRFSWQGGSGRAGDRVMVLAYEIQKKTAKYELNGARRAEGTETLSLSGYPDGTYHLYAAFMSMDGENQSDSRYLGSLKVGTEEEL